MAPLHRGPTRRHRTGNGGHRSPRKAGVACCNALHGLSIRLACGGLLEVRGAERHPERPLAPELFHPRQGGPGIAPWGGNGMAPCMRRVGLGDPGRVARPGHARLDGPDAPGEAALEGTGNEIRGRRRVAPPPVAPGVRDIRRILHHALHRPLALVAANGPGRDIAGGPGARTHLPDAPPTAQHQQTPRPIPPPIDDPEQPAQVVFRSRFGQGVGPPHRRAVPTDGWLGHPAVVLEEGNEPLSALEEGVDGRWRAPRLVGGGAPGLSVIGRGRGEILREVRWPACWDQPADTVEPINGGLERGGGRLARLQMPQRRGDQLLVG
jgi:hypothetical protein